MIAQKSLRLQCGVVLAIAGFVTAGGCSSDDSEMSATTPDPAVSQQHASDVTTQLVEALQRDHPDVVWAMSEEGQFQLSSTGICRFYGEKWTADVNVFERDGSWDAVITAINPVLAEANFPQITGEADVTGPAQGLRSRDASGLELELLVQRDETELRISGIVADSGCG